MLCPATDAAATAANAAAAGVDYEAILRQAEQEADVIIWDGGNNDAPFYRRVQAAGAGVAGAAGCRRHAG